MTPHNYSSTLNVSLQIGEYNKEVDEMVRPLSVDFCEQLTLAYL
jgi:hypothetical protein